MTTHLRDFSRNPHRGDDSYYNTLETEVHSQKEIRVGVVTTNKTQGKRSFYRVRVGGRYYC